MLLWTMASISTNQLLKAMFGSGRLEGKWKGKKKEREKEKENRKKKNEVDRLFLYVI